MGRRKKIVDDNNSSEVQNNSENNAIENTDSKGVEIEHSDLDINESDFNVIVNHVVKDVVEKLRPEMQNAIERKTADALKPVFESLKADLQDIRANMKTPQVASSSGGNNIDLKSILKEAEKVIPGLSSMIPGLSNAGAGVTPINGMAGNGNAQNTSFPQGAQVTPPPGLSDPYEYAQWIESNARTTPNQIQNQSAGPASPPAAGGLLSNPMMLMQLLNMPIVQQLLGVQPQGQGMNQLVQAFINLALNNAMADFQLGGFIRKGMVMQAAKNNPLLNDYAAQLIKGEDQLIGKPLLTITGQNNSMQNQAQSPGENQTQ